MNLKLRNLGKKTAAIALAILMVLTGMVFTTSKVSAEAFGDYEYTENVDGTITINRYNGMARNIEIPSTIDGKIVTVIGDYSFNNCALTSVKIPNSVTTIGVYAFSYNQLTSVIIPNSVTTIGNFAFWINQLTSVTLSNNVSTIYDMAFADNYLTSLTIPDSVKVIGAGAFGYNQLTNVIIPAGVEQIFYGAFQNNSTLTKAAILNKDTEIGAGGSDNPFAECSSDLKLYGYANSTASEYAANNNLGFSEIKEITDSMIGDIPTQYYLGKAVEPTVVVKDGGTTLRLGENYTVSYSNNNAIGEGTVTVTGIGDYEYATATKTFAIKQQPVNTTVAKDDTIGGAETPKTGDTSDMGLWIALIVLAVGTTAGAVAYRKKTYK